MRKTGAVTPRKNSHHDHGKALALTNFGSTNEKKVCPDIIINIANILAKSNEGTRFVCETVSIFLFFQKLFF